MPAPLSTRRCLGNSVTPTRATSVDYCSADPERLKATILVNATDPNRAATTIKHVAAEKCVAAITPLLPEGLPVDDPSLATIWNAMGDEDLPISVSLLLLRAALLSRLPGHLGQRRSRPCLPPIPGELNGSSPT